MLESIKTRLIQDIDSPELRVIILRANGPVFSSGHNLKELVRLFLFRTLTPFWWIIYVIF